MLKPACISSLETLAATILGQRGIPEPHGRRLSGVGSMKNLQRPGGAAAFLPS